MNPKKRSTGSQLENRAYALSYALSSMKSNLFRSASLALTLGLAISLLSSNMVWADTGVHITINEYLEESSYQMLVWPMEGSPETGALAQDYLESNPLIESSHRVESTIGIFDGSRLQDDTIYDMTGTVYSQGIKDCRVVIANDEFLNIASKEFIVNGTVDLGVGDVLVSYDFVNFVEDIFDETLTVNSTFDLALLTSPQIGANLTLGSMGRVNLESLRIVGIYEMKSTTSLIDRAFPSQRREIWDWTNVEYFLLGIRDSVILLRDSIPLENLEINDFFPTPALVRVSSDGLISAGEEKIYENLITLTTRLDERFNVTVDGIDHMYVLQWNVNNYLNTISYSILNLPLFLLAVVLSVFAADAFMAPRQTEVGILRSKGASSRQVYGIFLWESVIMALFGLVLGLLLSASFAALIPSSLGFMMFDWDTYFYYLTNTTIGMETLFYSLVLCVLPTLLVVLYMARRTAKTDISQTFADDVESLAIGNEAFGFTLGASMFLLIMVVGLVIFVPIDPVMLFMNLGLGTASWFFVAYNGSRISRAGLANLSSKLSFVLGQKNRISAAYLRMRKGRIIPLMLVLVLTMSSTISFAVQAESLRIDLQREAAYAIGADLRMDGELRPFNFSETLESYDGIKQAIPVYRCLGTVGREKLIVTALDPVEYAAIGLFEETSFYSEEPSAVLANLSSVNNGIIISAAHADSWNKTLGDILTIQLYDIPVTMDVNFNITGIVFSAPGFGFASISDIPPSEVGSGFGFQSGLGGFMLANLEFVASQLGKYETGLYLASLDEDANSTAIIESLIQIPDLFPVTSDTFDFKTSSLPTYLFLTTIEGLSSIGFVMSVFMSIFALSIFLGSVVRERKKEYAILRALGGSRGQIVKMVFSEFTGVVIAALAVSLVLGTIFGYVMGFLLTSMGPFSRMLPATITFPIEFLALVLLFEILIMIAGAYIPAREAGRTDPAIMLRNL